MLPIETIITLNEETLNKQSRSFAIPILQLDECFRIPVMVQYNLNKTIDTIEDHPHLTIGEKISFIERFCVALKEKRHCEYLQNKLLNITEHNESFVLRNYEATIALFNSMSDAEQGLATHWTLEMAKGMCHYLQTPIITPADLNDYCYYVAGTVGVFLTDLLALNGCGIHPEFVENAKSQAIHFGLFLQKLNVIRDFSEDTMIRNRLFWPQAYFQQDLEKMQILNRLCKETLDNDVRSAIAYFSHIPQGNESFDYFIRYILGSGLQYLKLLINNPLFFSEQKIRLPKILIQQLYNRVVKQTKNEFTHDCERLYQLCIESMSACFSE